MPQQCLRIWHHSLSSWMVQWRFEMQSRRRRRPHAFTQARVAFIQNAPVRRRQSKVQDFQADARSRRGSERWVRLRRAKRDKPSKSQPRTHHESHLHRMGPGWHGLPTSSLLPPTLLSSAFTPLHLHHPLVSATPLISFLISLPIISSRYIRQDGQDEVGAAQVRHVHET